MYEFLVQEREKGLYTIRFRPSPEIIDRDQYICHSPPICRVIINGSYIKRNVEWVIKSFKEAATDCTLFINEIKFQNMITLDPVEIKKNGSNEISSNFFFAIDSNGYKDMVSSHQEYNWSLRHFNFENENEDQAQNPIAVVDLITSKVSNSLDIIKEEVQVFRKQAPIAKVRWV